MVKHIFFLIPVIFFCSCKTVKLVKMLNKGSVAEKEFTVQVPFETRMNLMIIKVVIKGKTYDFLVDTGAPNVVSKELAAELGLETKVTKKTGDSQGGSDNLDFVEIDSITINGLTFMGTGAAVANLKQSNEIACLDIDGFIGANLMKHAVWQIDYDAKVFTIASSKDKLNIPENKIVLPFKPATSGTPKVSVSYNNVTEQSVTFDTGSNGSFSGKRSTYDKIMKDSVQPGHNFGVGRNASGLFGSNGGDTTLYALVTVGMGGWEFKNQLGKFKDAQASIMGNAFLKAFRVIIDWNEREVYLIQNRAPEPDDLNNFGFSVSRDGNKLLIGFLMNNSEAEKAGMKIGDQITAINGVDYLTLTDELWCGILYNGITDKKENVVKIETIREENKASHTINRKSFLLITE